LLCLCRCRDEWLFDYNVFACLERCFREGEMGIGSCGNDNDVEGGIRDQLIGRVVDFRGRVVFRGVVIGFGGSLDNGVEGEGGGDEDEGDVEDFRGQAGMIVSF
jgi:hypothetical protein